MSQPDSPRSQDLDQRGLCHCPAPHVGGKANRDFACRCLWGHAIGALQDLAYRAAPTTALLLLPEVMLNLTVALADIRRHELADRAAHWEGTVQSFLETFEITRSTYDRLGLKVPKH